MVYLGFSTPCGVPIPSKVHRVHEVHIGRRVWSDAIPLTQIRKPCIFGSGDEIAVAAALCPESQLPPDDEPLPMRRDLPLEVLAVAGKEALRDLLHGQALEIGVLPDFLDDFENLRCRPLGDMMEK